MNLANNLNLSALASSIPGVYLWAKDLNSIYMDANEECQNLFGLNKAKKSIQGLSDAEIPCKISEFADTFVKHDQLVISTGRSTKILEVHPDAGNNWKIMLNTKNPLRNEKNEIVGTFAYCVDISEQLGMICQKLATLEIEVFSKNRFAQSSFLLQQAPNNLTQREMECLFYFLRGKTSKEVASIINISTRTVEKYLINLKVKFSVHTKSLLIQKAIENGFLSIIPPRLLDMRLSEIV